ncbi:MAG: TldD/PmbA family protein [Candidatus Dormibacteraeota bacterium]|nr:TldD/PmbA family protein [Candidatus Dormibacteraeota bacterium]
MEDVTDRVLDAATAAGASYADCRVVERTVQSLTVKNGAVNVVSQFEDSGVGVRVLVDGAWGFAGTQRTDAAGLEEAARLAVRLARASARTAVAGVRLAPVQVIDAVYTTPTRIDPFGVSIERKLELLLAADAAMDVPGVVSREGELAAERRHQLFASSEGSRIEQTITETGGGLSATAARDGEVQTRSYPNSFGRQQLCAGWETIEEMDLVGHARQGADEAVALLRADLCPSGSMTLILDPTQAALQVHESCGHPTELDRVLGYEAAYAGTSFLMPEMLDRFRYGSEAVTITADSTAPRGLGTFGFDDEGVAAQRTVLIDHGLFTGYLTSRETAVQFGRPSGGTVRAESWNRLPLIRMTNINLEPGTSSLEEMIAGTEHGVYLQTNRSWSIDDRRLNFQFGTQVGWEIRDGKIVRMVRNPLYSGSTPEFWNSCDAVGGPHEWAMYGVINCGKGQPSQGMHVGHAAAPCRFRNVAVRPA